MMNQYRYRETLENSLLPSKDIMFESEQDWIYQQDLKHARCIFYCKGVRPFISITYQRGSGMDVRATMAMNVVHDGWKVLVRGMPPEAVHPTSEADQM